MSLGYADRLKPKRNLGGQLGAQEFHQSLSDIEESVQELASWVADAQRVFVFTGAGISTSCGIPDFRGPKGIWTLRKRGEPVPSDFTPFEFARPSLTHQVIAALVARGKVPYVCSQNVDGLHMRSGVPRDRLAELHGNCFAERCGSCGAEYFRDFQMETVDFQSTGRSCTAPSCGAPLRDNILDWDTPLPEAELEEAVRQAEEADVALVLGTSLQIQPANEIPVLTRDEGGKLVIVNLQKTPKDRRANLIIRSRVDLVMALLAQRLQLKVPSYRRHELLVVQHAFAWEHMGSTAAAGGGQAGATAVAQGSCGAGSGEHSVPACGSTGAGGSTQRGSSGAGSWSVTLTIGSRHGPTCPVPIVDRLELQLAGLSSGSGVSRKLCGARSSDAGGMQEAIEQAEGPHAADWGPCSSGWLQAPEGGGPFTHTFRGLPGCLRRLHVTLRLQLVKWADQDKRSVTLRHSVDVPLTDCAVLVAAQQAPSSTAPVPAVRAADGVPVTDIASSSGACAFPLPASLLVQHEFVSQETQYDPAAVVEAFRADPPPVVLPEPPKKRAKPPPPPTTQDGRPVVLHSRTTRTALRARGGSIEPSSSGAAAQD